MRERGPHTLWEIPPSEIQVIAHRISAQYGLRFGKPQHLKAILSCYELECSQELGDALSEILKLDIPYVAPYIWSLEQAAAAQTQEIFTEERANFGDTAGTNHVGGAINIKGLAVAEPEVMVFVEFIDPGHLYQFTFTDGPEDLSRGLISVETPFGRALATALIDEVTEVAWNGEPKKVIVKNRQWPRYNPKGHTSRTTGDSNEKRRWCDAQGSANAVIEDGDRDKGSPTRLYPVSIRCQ